MGCVQSYFRKGSYDVYEAHNAGLSPSSTQSEKAALADGVAEGELDKDLVIVDADEIKLAEKAEPAAADANGSSTTGIGVAATAAAAGVAGATAAAVSEALSGDVQETTAGSEVVEEPAESRAASATSRPQSGSDSASVDQPPEAEAAASRPTSASEEQGSRPASASVEQEQSSRPTSAAEPVQEEEIRPESAVVSESASSRPVSGTPAESSTRPESAVESASPAVNPETGTPLITYSRPLSSEGTVKEESRPTTAADKEDASEKPAEGDEAIIEGRVEESETKEADSSQPASELISEQAPSTVIDAEELGVKQVEANEGNDTSSRPASGNEATTVQESTPQPAESRPASGNGSNERPDSAISVGDSVLESSGRSEALSVREEDTSRPESASQQNSSSPVEVSTQEVEAVVETAPSVEESVSETPASEATVIEAEPQVDVVEEKSEVEESVAETTPLPTEASSEAVESTPSAPSEELPPPPPESDVAEPETEAAESKEEPESVPTTGDEPASVPTIEVTAQAEEPVTNSAEPEESAAEVSASAEPSAPPEESVIDSAPTMASSQDEPSSTDLPSEDISPSVVPQTEEPSLDDDVPVEESLPVPTTAQIIRVSVATTEVVEAIIEREPELVDTSEQEDDSAQERAATTIQAGFRGYQTRQALRQQGEDVTSSAPEPSEAEDDSDLEAAATRIQAGFRGYQARQALRQQGEQDITSAPEPSEDDSDMETAATKIQANFRGYMARKTLEDEKRAEADIDNLPPPLEMDPDEQMNAAATTIQANFRGFQARQALRKEEEGEEEGDNEAETVEDDLPPPPPVDENDQLNAAATTIQANFRGFQTRQAIRKQVEGANDEGADEELPPPPPEEEQEERVLETSSDPLLDSAATKIQATFRGHQVRKNLQEENAVEEGTDVDTGESTAGDSPQVEIPEIDESTAATKIQASFRGYQVRKGLKNENDEPTAEEAVVTNEQADATENDADLEAAATTIQANFRGFQTRKALAAESESTAEVANETADVTESKTSVVENEEAVINDTQNDADLEAAATKIQANFRGFQVRQTLRKGDEEAEEGEDTQEVETGESIPEDTVVTESVPQEEDPSELNEAATKIQANFRGYQTRQLLKMQNEGGLVHAVPAIAIDSPVSEAGSEAASIEAMNAAATKIQANFRGFQTRQSLRQLNDEDISESIAAGSPETEAVDDMELNNAATVIQANFRGFQARQALKNETEDAGAASETVSTTDVPATEPAGTDEDPALHAAATTIQANFRGFQTRKNLQTTTNQEEGVAGESLDTLSGSGLAAEESETSLTEVTGDASVITDTSEREVEVGSPPAETPRSPETGEKFQQAASNMTSVDEEETRVQVEDVGEDLPLPPPPVEDPTDSSSLDLDSTISSAATKIQAGVRGYIARKQLLEMRSSTTASTTAPSLPDSQQSAGPSVSLDDDGVQAAKSPETEVQNQPNNALDDDETDLLMALTASQTGQDEAKALSLDSQLVGDGPKQELRSSASEPTAKTVTDEEDLLVWQTLQKEMEAAATKIQSNYRGYRTRQRLHREDAVQMPTTSSSTISSPPPSQAAPLPSDVTVPTSGEFHDMVVLSPPSHQPTAPPPPATDSVPNSGEFHDMVVLPPPTSPTPSTTEQQQEQPSNEENAS